MILDLTMPVFSGFDVLNVVGKITKLPRLPIAVLSNSTRASERNHTLTLGACCAYQKPGTADEMQRVLQDMITKCIQPPGKSECC